uniref:Peptidase_M3 domain-containing protein n=1 Tax=Macrostomum lignano TaxID=282301 RepID=A0A1I8GM28_9PLAT
EMRHACDRVLAANLADLGAAFGRSADAQARLAFDGDRSVGRLLGERFVAEHRKFANRLSGFLDVQLQELSDRLELKYSPYAKYLKEVYGNKWMSFPLSIYNRTHFLTESLYDFYQRKSHLRKREVDFMSFLEDTNAEELHLMPTVLWKRFGQMLPQFSDPAFYPPAAAAAAAAASPELPSTGSTATVGDSHRYFCSNDDSAYRNEAGSGSIGSGRRFDQQQQQQLQQRPGDRRRRLDQSGSASASASATSSDGSSGCSRRVACSQSGHCLALLCGLTAALCLLLVLAVCERAALAFSASSAPPPTPTGALSTAQLTSSSALQQRQLLTATRPTRPLLAELAEQAGRLASAQATLLNGPGFAGAFKLEARVEVARLMQLVSRFNYDQRATCGTHASCPDRQPQYCSLGGTEVSPVIFDDQTCNFLPIVSANVSLARLGAQSDALAQLLTDARSIARALCSLSVCGLLLAACYHAAGLIAMSAVGSATSATYNTSGSGGGGVPASSE